MPNRVHLIASGFAPAQAETVVGRVATVAAAGSSQATATAVTVTNTHVTSGSGGVVLPAANPGDTYRVINDMGGACNVYPPSGAAINDASANAAFSMNDNTAATFLCKDSTRWLSIPRVAS